MGQRTRLVLSLDRSQAFVRTAARRRALAALYPALLAAGAFALTLGLGLRLTPDRPLPWLAAAVALALAAGMGGRAALGRERPPEEEGPGELRLEGTRLDWQLGRRTWTLLLDRPYWGKLRFGPLDLEGEEGVMVHLEQEGVRWVFRWSGVLTLPVQARFPEPDFTAGLPVAPEGADLGFDLEGRDPQQRAFLDRFLEVLWETREHNELYRIFAAYPWDTPPAPDVPYVRHISLRSPAPAATALRARLDLETVRSFAGIRVTPHLLLVPESPTAAFLLPLGHVQAEIVTPPAWVVGSPDLILRFQGPDARGKKVEVSLPLRGVSQRERDEAEILVRFVNRTFEPEPLASEGADLETAEVEAQEGSV